MKPHVLVIPNTWPSAVNITAGTFFRDQVEALHQHGVQVGIAAPLILPMGQLSRRFQLPIPLREVYTEEAAYPIFRYAAYNLVPGYSGYQQKVYQQAIEHLFESYVKEKGKPDILHAHVGLWAGWASAILARKHGIPFVLTEHSSALKRGLVRPREKRLLLDCYRQANQVIAVSTDLAKSIARIGYTKPVKVVPNTVDLSRFDLPASPDTRNPKQLLTVALLTPNKGVDLLLKAFAGAIEQEPTLTLKIVGDGSAKPALEKLAKELNLEERVTFTGILPKEELPAIYQQSGLMLSTSYVETFGVVLVEALASGTPIVATRSGGPEDIVSSSNGVLCEPGNVIDLQKAILTIVGNSKAYPPEAMRQSVVEKFDTSSTVKQLKDIYQILKQSE